MGAKRVTLNRRLAQSELSLIETVLDLDDKGKRKTLIAFLIREASKSIDNLEIAKRAVAYFPFKASRDPVGTTRSLVTRTINRLNDGASVSDLIKQESRESLELTRWSEQRVRQMLHEFHLEDPKNFSYTKIKNTAPSLISHIEQYHTNFQAALENFGINPLVHLDDVPWGTREDSIQLLRWLLLDITRRCGIESLNYNSMYQHHEAILGIHDNAHEKYSECKKFGCIRKVNGSAIIRKIELIFGKYSEGVASLMELTSEEYSDLIERKSANIPLTTYLKKLEDFINNSPETWTIAEFHSAHRSVHHGLHNKKDELTFIKHSGGDVMLASVAEIVFRQSDSGFDEFVASGLDETFEAVKSRRTTNPQARLEGYAFQKLFLDMLTDERVGLVVGKDFRYEQFFDKQKCEALGHSPACKMDFIFPNFIVDTKRSITATSKINHQTSRYLDHTDHLIRVTLNQKYKTALENNKRLTDMTVYEFIERSEDLLGVEIPNRWKSQFLDYARDAANRIEDAWENSFP